MSKCCNFSESLLITNYNHPGPPSLQWGDRINAFAAACALARGSSGGVDPSQSTPATSRRTSRRRLASTQGRDAFAAGRTRATCSKFDTWSRTSTLCCLIGKCSASARALSAATPRNRSTRLMVFRRACGAQVLGMYSSEARTKAVLRTSVRAPKSPLQRGRPLRKRRRRCARESLASFRRCAR